MQTHTIPFLYFDLLAGYSYFLQTLYILTAKGAIDMADNHNKKADSQKQVKPSDIKGKLEIPDTRERRDGPGGN